VGVFAASGGQLGEHLPGEHLGDDVVACAELQAELGPFRRLFVTAERVERLGELAGLGREEAALAHLLEQLAAAAGDPLRGLEVTGVQLDPRAGLGKEGLSDPCSAFLHGRDRLRVPCARLLESSEQAERRRAPRVDQGLVPVPGNDLVQPKEVLVEGLRSHARLRDEQGDGHLFQLAVAGATGVLDRALGGGGTGVEAAATVRDPADRAPEGGEPFVVAGLLEERPRFLGEGLELLEPPLGVGLREEPHVLDARVQLAQPVASHEAASQRVPQLRRRSRPSHRLAKRSERALVDPL